MDNKNNPTPAKKENLNTKAGAGNEKVYKGTILALVIAIGVLVFLLITNRQNLQEMSSKVVIAEQIGDDLQWELDSVLKDYTVVKNEYDSVLTRQDSIIQASAKEIERLIAQQGDYHRIRRQLNLLRDITQNYVREMDSLYTENQVLKAENVEMQREIQRVTQRTTELAQTKEDLEGKVEVAAALRAFEMDITPIRTRGRGREEETDRARRTDLLRVCFVVGANPVATAGNKNAFVRIAKPSGEIMRISDEDAYSFAFQGDTLQFTMNTQFNYQNTDTEVCMDWTRDQDYEEGMYLVSIFTNEFRLGETQFSLR